MTKELRIVRETRDGAIQSAIDSVTAKDETCRGFYAEKVPEVTKETQSADWSNYRHFKIGDGNKRTGHRIAYCVNCGKLVDEEQADKHDRIHAMGGTIL